jgi:hypothetical protein
MNRPLLVLSLGLVAVSNAGAQRSAVAPGLAGTPSAALHRSMDLERELAGVALAQYPHFTFTRTFNEGAPIHVALDTATDPDLADRTVDLYLMAHRSKDEWIADPVLSDLRGGPTTMTAAPGGLLGNVITLDPGTMNGNTGTTDVGVGYDVVLDVNRDGRLDPDDQVDGWGDEAGLYVVQDLSAKYPSAGPYDVTEVFFNGGGGFKRQDIYYPTNVAQLGALPLIVVSHGNGHNYQWYDHIGYHMASWGYVVMSHENNTGPGIESAATTTLRNTNSFLGNLDVIANGELLGHVDSSQMVWIGHSRGGEGVVRAYKRLVEGDPIATRYSAADVKLVSSMAPTDFLGTLQSNPLGVTYHLWTGAADDDVNGCADCDVCQTFHLHERAAGARYSTYIYGAGHGDFHDGGGSSVAKGPCKIGRAATHAIMRGYLLALVKWVLEKNPACQDFLWRQWETFHPIGAPSIPCVNSPGGDAVVVDLMYQESPQGEKFVLDDFQTNPSPQFSSSGGAVATNARNLVEDRLDDANSTFNPSGSDPMNGMTLDGPGDDSRGIVFEWDQPGQTFLSFELPPEARDVSSFRHLSFRATQSTRDVLTVAESGDLAFAVELEDALERKSQIRIDAYGGGIEEPYQRSGCGKGSGWGNGFETIRIPLGDFRAEGNQLELGAIKRVTFLFGAEYGSRQGRIGLDEIEFTTD